MARRKLSGDDSWANVTAKFIDFLSKLAPSADKDMRANIFIDGSVVLLYVFIFKLIIEPSFNKLEPIFKVVLVGLVLFAIYQIPYRAIKSCYNLFIKKLRGKGYSIDEL